MEISAEKTNLMTNNISGINTKIMDRGFEYLVSVITDEGSKPEILSRIAQTTTALTGFLSIFLSFKIQLMGSLVTFTFLYACESWTLTAELQRRIQQAMEMRCYARYYTSHTKTMLPMRKSMPRSSRQFDHTKIS